MRPSKWLLAFLLAIALIAGGWPYRRAAMLAWMRHTGAVEPVGDAGMQFMGKPGRLVSIVGQRTQGGSSYSSGLAAVHTLVIFPGDSLGDGQGTHSSNAVAATIHEVWSVWSHARPTPTRGIVDVRYDAFLQKVQLGGHSYSLKNGNLFVVRYDGRGRASVQQLPRTVREADQRKAIEAFQALLPNDPAVLDVTGYVKKQPCPPRAVPAPAGAAST